MANRKAALDANQLAAAMVAQTMGSGAPVKVNGKNPAAVMLGHLGGIKGGKARAKSLSAVRRKAIAQAAAKSRWAKAKK